MAEQTTNVKTIDTVIVLRNDQTTAWESSDYVMFKGEVGIGYLANGNVIAKLGDGEHTWKDLKQLEGVFEEDLTLTHNFGRHKTVNGSVNAGGAGMTTSQWLINALSEVLNPKTNYPTAKLEANGYTTDTGTNEVGSKIKAIKWKTSTGNGSYVGNDGTGTYGTSNGTSNASGISSSNFTWSISNEVDTQTSSATSGTFTLSSDDYIEIDSTDSKTYALLNGTVTLDASKAYTPKNNIGQEYAAGKITGFDAAGTTTKEFTDIAITATGFRNSWYYVGTDCTTAIDSAFIRGTTAKNANTTDFGTLTIDGGTKRVMIAIPGTHSLTSVIDVDGMGLDVKDNFTTTTGVQVEGANGFEATDYTVFVCENANGMSATKFTFTIA